MQANNSGFVGLFPKYQPQHIAHKALSPTLRTGQCPKNAPHCKESMEFIATIAQIHTLFFIMPSLGLKIIKILLF
jgi:hypothetical protein